MALELITGKKGTPHISSNDVRALNRGIFGRGRLNDENLMEVTPNTGAKTIAIDTGSCIWSGMHIRNATAITDLSYGSPVNGTTVYLWLHYTKGTVGEISNVENIEFVTSLVNAPPDSGVIKNDLSDIDTDGYTLFYSFKHSDSGATVPTHAFTLLDSIGNVVTDMAELKTENDAFKAEVEAEIENINGVDVLAEELSDAGDSTFTNISLVTAVDSYRMIGFQIMSYTEHGYKVYSSHTVPTSLIAYDENNYFQVVEGNFSNDIPTYTIVPFVIPSTNKKDFSIPAHAFNGYGASPHADATITVLGIK